MKKKYDINKGDVFGHFTVLEELPSRRHKSGRVERLIKCECVCGNVRDVLMWNLIKRKDYVSCGCKTVSGLNFYKHGLSGHPLYWRYQLMLSRCYHKSNEAYKDYGGRGIVVCEEWRNDFLVFYNWAINNGFEIHLELDRFPDNNGNYEPSNCRWVTEVDNCNNRRNSILFDYKNQKLSLPQIARLEKIHYGTLYYRVKIIGISIIDAVKLAINKIKLNPNPIKENSMRNICRLNGVKYETVLSRMKYRNISFEESLKTYLE